MLSISATCKKILNDSGYWAKVKKYVSEHTNAMFTHRMCPEYYINAVEEVKKRWDYHNGKKKNEEAEIIFASSLMQ
jgi:hypothetical protein